MLLRVQMGLLMQKYIWMFMHIAIDGGNKYDEGCYEELSDEILVQIPIAKPPVKALADAALGFLGALLVQQQVNMLQSSTKI